MAGLENMTRAELLECYREAEQELHTLQIEVAELRKLEDGLAEIENERDELAEKLQQLKGATVYDGLKTDIALELCDKLGLDQLEQIQKLYL